MKISIQMVIKRNFGAPTLLCLASVLALGLSAPQPIPAQQPGTSSVIGTSSKQQTSVSAAASQASSVPQGGVASVATAAASAQEQLNTFEGKANLFGDESLWQIPIQLVRDSSAASSDDSMAKSASELSSNANERDEAEADDDDDDDSASLALDEQQDATSILAHQKAAGAGSLGSSPGVISASTKSSGANSAGSADLKTAAGYHHATPHHHAGYPHAADHDAGHYAGHHDGHYGKYFQYASVPYPYAWDFGYRRGNPYHTIERYEHGKGPHFQTKVKWSDKHAGYGVHVWDYNHDHHQAPHYGHHSDYDSHAPAPGHYAASHGHH